MSTQAVLSAIHSEDIVENVSSIRLNIFGVWCARDVLHSGLR